MSASTVRLREISDLIENLIIRPSSDSVVRVQHLAEIQHDLRKECDRIDAMEPDSEEPAGVSDYQDPDAALQWLMDEVRGCVDRLKGATRFGTPAKGMSAAIETASDRLRGACDIIDTERCVAKRKGDERRADSLEIGRLWRDVYVASVSSGASAIDSAEAASHAVGIATMPLGSRSDSRVRLK